MNLVTRHMMALQTMRSTVLKKIYPISHRVRVYKHQQMFSDRPNLEKHDPTYFTFRHSRLKDKNIQPIFPATITALDI